MTPSRLDFDRIEQIVKFFLLPKLSSSQTSSLISSLLHYGHSISLPLIELGDTFLTVLEDDIQSLHSSSTTTSLSWSEKQSVCQTNHEQRIGSLLEAQSPSTLRILQEDIAILHAPFAVIPGFRNQANGEPKCIDRHHQPDPLQEVLPEQLQPLVLSVHPMDFSVESKFPIVKLPASKDKLSTGSQAPATSANNNPLNGQGKLLADAPPLPMLMDPRSGPKKRRPVAADFFDPSDAPGLEVASAKPGAGTYSSEDITQLIEEEKANALKNGGLTMAEHINPTDRGITFAERQLGPRDDYLKYTVQAPNLKYSCDLALNHIEDEYLRCAVQAPNLNYSCDLGPNHTHGKKELKIIHLPADKGSVEEQASRDARGLDAKPIRSPVASRPQGNKMTRSDRTAQDVIVTIQNTLRSPHAEDQTAVKDRKRKRNSDETSNRKRTDTKTTEPEPGELWVTPVDPYSFKRAANIATGSATFQSTKSKSSTLEGGYIYTILSSLGQRLLARSIA
ncbi:MAG: hypothetical protein Q9226_005734 [Calogaya cf. arnoldii]